MKSYFLLYKRAKKLYDDGEITVTDIKSEEAGDTYYFCVNGHNVRLHARKSSNNRLWLREWECDCQHFSIWQDLSECKHVKGAEFFLMNGGFKQQ